MKFLYSNDYWPPFPVIEIILRNEDSALQTHAVEALVDSGADASLIPLSLLGEVKAYTVGSTHIRSHWGERWHVHLYRIDIKIDDITLPGVTVVGIDYGDEIILGRDTLNKLRLLLDGPAVHTEILD